MWVTVRNIALAGAVMCIAPAAARAQGIAENVDPLRLVVKEGDVISVTETTGRVVKGTIARLSGTSVTLRSGGREQQMMESDILTIRQRKDDSLADGARKGFVIGALLGVLEGAFAAEYFG